MKKLIALIILLGMTVFGRAQSNTAQQVADTVKQSVTTNLNEVVVQMLSGLKDASGEVYAASKMALVKSIDVVKEQAPDVVRQFIAWSFARSLLLYLVWLIPVGAGIYAAIRVKRYGRDNGIAQWNDDDKIGNVVTIILFWCASAVIFMVDTCNYGMDCLQIAVAPKVYILQYVIETAKALHN